MSPTLVEPDLELLRERRVLIDVRAPVEFRQGALPGAVNLPLMDDEERHLVGIEYKRAGQDAAIELGEYLVAGGVLAERVEAWRGLLARHPDALIYCFREASARGLPSNGSPRPGSSARASAVAGRPCVRRCARESMRRRSSRCWWSEVSPAAPRRA
ncbi:tRNA 2-selenouridine synthase [Halomonas elongata]|uniref:tRNA 2-selenouridine synthase n=1 Tax=Halomonas elongata TaxID=2746 RepID=A0A1B8NYE8_HALEL|nr:tRNA 2-selenouridine synthase [Halomonas elongata]